MFVYNPETIFTMNKRPPSQMNMYTIRTVRRIVEGSWTRDGAGVRLHRIFANDTAFETDPFLLLDTFDSTNPADYVKGFPLHPHRGIETYTYLISGEIDHKDTLGNAGRILGGQAQWMNSGSGIRHEEMPVTSPRLFGFQLWINLPKKHKMSKPTYHDIHTEDMPVVEENGITIRIVAGKYGKTVGPQGDYVQPLVFDITMKPDVEWELQISENDTLFTYMLEGDASFGEPLKPVQYQTAAIFSEGHILQVRSESQGSRFALFSGKPLKEPIAWGGPIVMNTRKELETAFRELDEGTFIKPT